MIYSYLNIDLMSLLHLKFYWPLLSADLDELKFENQCSFSSAKKCESSNIFLVGKNWYYDWFQTQNIIINFSEIFVKKSFAMNRLGKFSIQSIHQWAFYFLQFITSCNGLCVINRPVLQKWRIFYQKASSFNLNFFDASFALNIFDILVINHVQNLKYKKMNFSLPPYS